MKHKCDFCNEVKNVVHTSYGTTKYTRLICKDCIDRINAYHVLIGQGCVLKNDGSLEK